MEFNRWGRELLDRHYGAQPIDESHGDVPPPGADASETRDEQSSHLMEHLSDLRTRRGNATGQTAPAVPRTARPGGSPRFEPSIPRVSAEARPGPSQSMQMTSRHGGRITRFEYAQFLSAVRAWGTGQSREVAAQGASMRGNTLRAYLDDNGLTNKGESYLQELSPTQQSEVRAAIAQRSASGRGAIGGAFSSSLPAHYTEIMSTLPSYAQGVPLRELQKQIDATDARLQLGACFSPSGTRPTRSANEQSHHRAGAYRGAQRTLRSGQGETTVRPQARRNSVKAEAPSTSAAPVQTLIDDGSVEKTLVSGGFVNASNAFLRANASMAAVAGSAGVGEEALRAFLTVDGLTRKGAELLSRCDVSTQAAVLWNVQQGLNRRDEARGHAAQPTYPGMSNWELTGSPEPALSADSSLIGSRIAQWPAPPGTPSQDVMGPLGIDLNAEPEEVTGPEAFAQPAASDTTFRSFGSLGTSTLRGDLQDDADSNAWWGLNQATTMPYGGSYGYGYGYGYDSYASTSFHWPQQASPAHEQGLALSHLPTGLLAGVTRESFLTQVNAEMGYASAQGLNCLLDSLLQLVHGSRRWSNYDPPGLAQEVAALRRRLVMRGEAAPHGHIDAEGANLLAVTLAANYRVRIQFIEEDEDRALAVHPVFGNEGPLLHILHTPGHFQPLWPKN